MFSLRSVVLLAAVASVSVACTVENHYYKSGDDDSVDDDLDVPGLPSGSKDKSGGNKGNTSGNNTSGGTSGNTSSGTSGNTSGGTSGGNGNKSGNPGNSEGEPEDLAGIVDAHNDVRANVSPAPATPLDGLSWSEEAAQTARAWASQCKWNHNPGRGNFGENLYASSANAGSNAAKVVGSWASESASYNYSSNSCSGMCGHYTQVVWRDTTGVGCARNVCNTNNPFGGSGAWEIWVCNYAPPGNYDGQRPY